MKEVNEHLARVRQLRNEYQQCDERIKTLDEMAAKITAAGAFRITPLDKMPEANIFEFLLGVRSNDDFITKDDELRSLILSLIEGNKEGWQKKQEQVVTQLQSLVPSWKGPSSESPDSLQEQPIPNQESTAVHEQSSKDDVPF